MRASPFGPRSARVHGRQRGVSIVEALVALVVLSVGMLGIAGMFLESVRSNRTALVRTTAIQLANDMADRIRSNRGGRTDYNLATSEDPTTKAPQDCSIIECTPTQLAKYDLSQWYTAVQNTLPKGADGKKPQTAVTFTPGATTTDPGSYTIVTSWKEPGDVEYLSTTVEVRQIGS